jgi:hypothetical protein
MSIWKSSPKFLEKPLTRNGVLARLGALRIPSEAQGLRWDHIAWDSKSISIVASCKTEHHAKRQVRLIPLFPAIETELLKLFAEAEDGAENVFQGIRPDSNLRTQLEKIINRAGVKQWPKLFQNLRASRETELMAIFPAKDVCTWIGNTQQIAMKHYAMATEESFRRAVQTTTLPTETKAPSSDKLPNAENIGQNFGHFFGQSGESNRPKETSQNLPANEKTAESLRKEGFCGSMRTGDENHQTEISGRYWTRTNDLNDVNVAL